MNNQTPAGPAPEAQQLTPQQVRAMFVDNLTMLMYQFRLIPPGLEFGNVAEFHHKLGLLISEKPTHLTKRKLVERVEFMMEELLEFCQASGLIVDVSPTIDGENTYTGLHDVRVTAIDPDQDMAKQADSLVDLAYVTLGTAVMMGLPWGSLWNEVQRANMDKVPGVTHRGHKVDATKPEGWVGPRIDGVLKHFGYERSQFTNEADVVDNGKCRDDN